VTVLWSSLALAVGYALWWVMPVVLDHVGLGWTADFGQRMAVMLALSLLGRLESRISGRADH